MDPHRIERIREALRTELAEMIGYELEDPRLETVEVLDVPVTPDGKHAVVLVYTPAGDQAAKAALEALAGARQHLRRELALRLQLHHVPDLRFELGKGPDEESRMEQLFRRARKQHRKIVAAEEKSL